MRRFGERLIDYSITVGLVWGAGIAMCLAFALGFALGRDTGTTREYTVVNITSNRVAQRYIDSIAALQGRPRHDDAVQVVPKVQPQHGPRRSGRR